MVTRKRIAGTAILGIALTACGLLSGVDYDSPPESPANGLASDAARGDEAVSSDAGKSDAGLAPDADSRDAESSDAGSDAQIAACPTLCTEANEPNECKGAQNECLPPFLLQEMNGVPAREPLSVHTIVRSLKAGALYSLCMATTEPDITYINGSLQITIETVERTPRKLFAWGYWPSDLPTLCTELFQVPISATGEGTLQVKFVFRDIRNADSAGDALGSIRIDRLTLTSGPEVEARVGETIPIARSTAHNQDCPTWAVDPRSLLLIKIFTYRLEHPLGRAFGGYRPDTTGVYWVRDPANPNDILAIRENDPLFAELRATPTKQIHGPRFFVPVNERYGETVAIVEGVDRKKGSGNVIHCAMRSDGTDPLWSQLDPTTTRAAFRLLK
jgi:hypothetical protein